MARIKMKKIRRYIPWLLSILCIAGAAYSLYVQVDLFDPSSASEEMVTKWDEQMQPVREALPATVFEAGYLDAAGIPNSGAVFDEAEFFMTQYALAPVALIQGFQTPWIIGNFGNDVQIEVIQPWLEQTLHKYEIQNFGFGIYLIHDIPE